METRLPLASETTGELRKFEARACWNNRCHRQFNNHSRHAVIGTSEKLKKGMKIDDVFGPNSDRCTQQDVRILTDEQRQRVRDSCVKLHNSFSKYFPHRIRSHTTKVGGDSLLDSSLVQPTGNVAPPSLIFNFF